MHTQDDPLIYNTITHSRRINVMADCDRSGMEEYEEPLRGKFEYKKNKDGTINKNAVIRRQCRK